MSLTLEKQQLLDLFADNVNGAINPEDLRMFVESIYNTKEDLITRVTDVRLYDFSQMKAGQLIIVLEPNNAHGRNGIYSTNTDYPQGFSELSLITDNNEATVLLSEGLDGQILSRKNGQPVWVDDTFGYEIKGSIPVYDILDIKNPTKGDVYVSTTSNTKFFPTCQVGDGISFNGTAWVNIGQIRGPKGQDSTVPGPQGTVGPTGPDGIQGPQGTQGVQGFDGAAGAAGAQGKNGYNSIIRGQAPRASIYSITQKTTGDIWIINDKNDPENGHGLLWTGSRWDDAGLIRGEQGKQGPQGKDGVQGSQGVKGQNGQQGPTGPQGPQGIQGNRGLAGIQGPQGTKGKQGLKGIQGESIEILPPVLDKNSLPLTGHNGQVIYVENEGKLYAYKGSSFKPVGEIKGPQGKDGKDGVKGKDGTEIVAIPSVVDSSKLDQTAKVGTLCQTSSDKHLWYKDELQWNDIGSVEGPKGDAGLTGQQGLQGLPGPSGKDGTGVSIKGTAQRSDILAKTGTAGDMWLIDSTGADNGHGMVSDGQGTGASHWTDVGQIQGPIGPHGVTGKPGQQGPQGAAGQNGPQGVAGTKGADGHRGPQG